MRVIRIVAGAAALALAAPLFAQTYTTVTVPPSSGKVPPVSQNPQNGPGDSPEAIAKDAERDRQPDHYYNKPGATLADYDRDWQICRLIARGSATPNGGMTFVTAASPLAAGIGAGIGAAIGSAIAEGQARRANRRNCLLIKGWRLVKVPGAEVARVAALSPAEQEAWRDGMIGATTVVGEVTERKSFTQPGDPALNLDAPLSGPASLWLMHDGGAITQADAKLSYAFDPGEGALLVAFRRPDKASAGHSAELTLARYDMAARDLSYQPRDWKKKKDWTTYSVEIRSKDRKAAYELQLVRLTEGDYVIDSYGVGPQAGGDTTNCFGAPVFHVAAGRVTYLADWIPYMDVDLAGGKSLDGLLAYAPHPEDARKALATFQRALADEMVPADVKNGATYGCAGPVLDRVDVAGAASLASAAVQ